MESSKENVLARERKRRDPRTQPGGVPGKGGDRRVL